MAASTNQPAQAQPSSREYCLRWNNHQPNLVAFFGSLLCKESFVDVTLVSSEGKKLQAHKLVLSACSPYFQHVFENNPCKHPIVILKDVHYADLRTIVSFIYNGEVNISQERINSILMTAATLQVKGLAEVPADELKRVGGPRGSSTSTESTSTVRTQPPPLQSSSSWGSGDTKESTSQGEIPRKKLKKSVSATVSGGSTSISTNGEHSSATGSLDSGAGASMSRSLDDGNDAGDGNGRCSTAPPRTSVPPPPLTAANQLLPKSRSVDQNVDPINIDSEVSSGGFSENQTYDESSMGTDRGYELEIADVKIEAQSDGEIEFDEESFNHPDNPEFVELKHSNPFPNVPSSSSFYHQPVRHFASSHIRRRVRYPKFPGQDNSLVVSAKYEQAIQDLVDNPALTFREAAQRHALNASSVWYHYRMKHGYRRKVECD